MNKVSINLIKEYSLYLSREEIKGYIQFVNFYRKFPIKVNRKLVVVAGLAQFRAFKELGIQEVLIECVPN